MRGVFYGIFIVYTVTLFLCYALIELLISLFKGLEKLITPETGFVISLFFPNISLETLYVYFQILTIIFAAILSITLKEAEGSSKLGMFLNFIVMLWIGSIIAVAVPYAMKALLKLV